MKIFTKVTGVHSDSLHLRMPIFFQFIAIHYKLAIKSCVICKYVSLFFVSRQFFEAAMGSSKNEVIVLRSFQNALAARQSIPIVGDPGPVGPLELLLFQP